MSCRSAAGLRHGPRHWPSEARVRTEGFQTNSTWRCTNWRTPCCGSTRGSYGPKLDFNELFLHKNNEVNAAELWASAASIPYCDCHPFRGWKKHFYDFPGKIIMNELLFYGLRLISLNLNISQKYYTYLHCDWHPFRGWTKNSPSFMGKLFWMNFCFIGRLILMNSYRYCKKILFWNHIPIGTYITFKGWTKNSPSFLLVLVDSHLNFTMDLARKWY